MKSSLFIGLALAGTAFFACDFDPAQPPLGSVELTASSPTLAAGFTTLDGWSVKYTKFQVSMTQVNVEGSDGVVTASNTALVFDLATATDPISLVSADNRVARPWQNVNFEIGAATTDSFPTPPLAQTDVDALVANNLSVYVEATIQKDTTTKTLQLGFTNDVSYADCGTGVVIPKGGSVTADIGFAADALFADSIVGTHALRADPFASADGNNDGMVTLAELNAESILAARTGGSTYLTGGTDVTSFGAFVSLVVPTIVATFAGTGKCTVTVNVPDAGTQAGVAQAHY